MSTIKTYERLITIDNYIDRFNYLKLKGQVGKETFGSKRYLNQQFYRSREWRRFRNEVIIRDKGLDLAMDGYYISGKIIVHHIEPITSDVLAFSPELALDLNNAICVSYITHQAIHYGDDSILKELELIERRPNDTVPWR